MIVNDLTHGAHTTDDLNEPVSPHSAFSSASRAKSLPILPNPRFFRAPTCRDAIWQSRPQTPAAKANPFTQTLSNSLLLWELQRGCETFFGP
ncbi:hypothetical protein NMY22_g16844 [Coprinellus aureogranulatus]|nr:hypothetical protein NMY22_g16844 [Coprinellus aureogranulatus]